MGTYGNMAFLFIDNEKIRNSQYLALTRMGTIHVKAVSYLQKEKSKRRLARNLGKLKPGLLKS